MRCGELGRSLGWERERKFKEEIGKYAEHLLREK
jgi:hypothetical protein